MSAAPSLDLSDLSGVDPKACYKLGLDGEGTNWYELYAKGPAWLVPFRRELAWWLMQVAGWVDPWELRETDEKVPVYDIRDWCAEHPVDSRGIPSCSSS